MNNQALSVKGIGLTLPWRFKLRLGSIREQKRILHDIDFDLTRGEIVALMGPNGCGKSTLFRVISQIYSPTEGSVSIGVAGKVSVMALSMGFMSALTGRENVVLQGLITGLDKTEAMRAADQVLDRVGKSQLGADGRYDMPYHTYSAGMKASIASSSALLNDADVILVDEVFGVGDNAFRQNLREKLQERAREGAAVMVVAHDTEVLQSLCSRAILLDNGTQVSDNVSLSDANKFMGKNKG